MLQHQDGFVSVEFLVYAPPQRNRNFAGRTAGLEAPVTPVWFGLFPAHMQSTRADKTKN
jgi:hypothetical protein